MSSSHSVAREEREEPVVPAPPPETQASSRLKRGGQKVCAFVKAHPGLLMAVGMGTLCLLVSFLAMSAEGVFGQEWSNRFEALKGDGMPLYVSVFVGVLAVSGGAYLTVIAVKRYRARPKPKQEEEAPPAPQAATPSNASETSAASERSAAVSVETGLPRVGERRLALLTMKDITFLANHRNELSQIQWGDLTWHGEDTTESFLAQFPEAGEGKTVRPLFEHDDMETGDRHVPVRPTEGDVYHLAILPGPKATEGVTRFEYYSQQETAQLQRDFPHMFARTVRAQLVALSIAGTRTTPESEPFDVSDVEEPKKPRVEAPGRYTRTNSATSSASDQAVQPRVRRVSDSDAESDGSSAPSERASEGRESSQGSAASGRSSSSSSSASERRARPRRRVRFKG